MQLKQVAVQFSIVQQVRLELDLRTRFGIQVNAVFPVVNAATDGIGPTSIVNVFSLKRLGAVIGVWSFLSARKGS